MSNCWHSIHLFPEWKTEKQRYKLCVINSSPFGVLHFVHAARAAHICFAVEEDDQDLTYADVRIVQQKGRRAEQRAEEEVEYGQVKISKKPRQCEIAMDDTVYAKVRKSR